MGNPDHLTTEDGGLRDLPRPSNSVGTEHVTTVDLKRYFFVSSRGHEGVTARS